MVNTKVDAIIKLLDEVEIENEDMILQFAKEAQKDPAKAEAIERLFDGSKSGNPFKEGASYYSLLDLYQDVLNEM